MNPHASIGRVMLLEELIERPVTGGNRRVDGPRQPIILRVGHQCFVAELVGISVHRYQDAVPALLFGLVAPSGDSDYGYDHRHHRSLRASRDGGPLRRRGRTICWPWGDSMKSLMNPRILSSTVVPCRNTRSSCAIISLCNICSSTPGGNFATCKSS